MKKTSVNGVVLEHSASPPWAVLADFDIGGAALKKDHTDWLTEVLFPYVKSKGSKGVWIVDLKGRASASGSDDFNHWLSGERIAAVESHIRTHVPAKVNFAPQLLGEGSPNDPAKYENELDRSVEVRATFFPNPTVRPRRPRLIPKMPKYNPWKPPKAPKTTKLMLKVLRSIIEIDGVSAKFGLGTIISPKAVAKLFIEIKKTGTAEVAHYEFAAKGMGSVTIGAPSFPGFGLDDWSEGFSDGDAIPFEMKGPFDVEDFAVKASFSKLEGFNPALRLKFAHGGSVRFSGIELGTKDSAGRLTPPATFHCTIADELKLVTSPPSWV